MSGNKWVNTPSTPDPIDTKIEEWWKEMGKWLANVISWASNTLVNVLSTWIHLVWAWASKIQECFCDDSDKALKSSRETITKAHRDKVKTKGQSSLNSAWQTIWWWWNTLKWTWKVAIHSVRKTIKDINTDNTNVNKKTTPTKSSTSKSTWGKSTWAKKSTTK